MGWVVTTALILERFVLGDKTLFTCFWNCERYAQYLSWKTMLSSDFHCMKENLGRAKVQLEWVVRWRKKSPKNSINPKVVVALHWKSFIKVYLFVGIVTFWKPYCSSRRSLKKSLWRAIALRGQPWCIHPHIRQITSL